MSPKTKKILMVLGAAVGGYVIYTKVIKKPAAAPPKPLVSAGTIKSAAISLATAQIQKLSGDHLLEELGVSESLGSLGSKRR